MFGRLTGSARAVPVTRPSSSGATSSPDDHRGRSAARFELGRPDAVVHLVLGVAGQAVVVDAPGPALVGRRRHEPGEELGHMGVGRAGEDAEMAEDLQFDSVVGHDVGLGPVPRGVDAVPVRGSRRGHPDRLTLELTGMVEDVARAWRSRPRHRCAERSPGAGG